MSSGQKVVKVLAIIFAIFITVNIFSAIIAGISIFAGVMYDSKKDSITSTIIESEETIEEIDELTDNVKIKIDLETCNLEIRPGEKYKVETTTTRSDINYYVHDNNTLEIKEKNTNWFSNNDSDISTVILYVPQNAILEELNVSTDIGTTKINNIETKKLDINAGVGNITLKDIISNETEIDGGAGSFSSENCNFTNLDFDCGVGTTKISGDLKGECKISCGVGKTQVDLQQEKDNYSIKTSSGIGKITLNGEKCQDNAKYGNGENIIKIDGGVGSIEITTK